MISFSNFRILDPETADIARELIGDAKPRHSPFLSFMNLWMGFNGWMESVTDAPNDRAMLTALSDNARMKVAFEELLERDGRYGSDMTAFSRLWPVLNVRDVRRKLGRDAFWQERDDLMAACVGANVKMEPAGWQAGYTPTWPQVLLTIYLIRCNLFHGAKSPQNLRDRDLVSHADRVLRGYIEGSGCFEWYDQA